MMVIENKPNPTSQETRNMVQVIMQTHLVLKTSNATKEKDNKLGREANQKMR